ncbi:MAG: hypothetical protein AB6733_24295 [Clostridiaceae bacterium]
MKYDYIKYLKESCAFIPFYKENRGKGTAIYLKDGKKVYTKHSIRKVLDDYCAINFKDINQLRKLSCKVLNRKLLNPIYISNEIVMLPVKSMKPLIAGDKCFGYINLNYIKDFIIEDKKIKLKSGAEINYLDKSTTIKNRLADGALLSRKIENRALEEVY